LRPMAETLTKKAEPGTWREIDTRRWGKLRYREEDVIRFPRGLLGFEALRRWAIFIAEDHEPFQWMISLDDPDVAFVVVDPLLICPDYSPKVSQRELEELEPNSPEDIRVLGIVTLGKTPEESTINLSGPLFINIRKKLGKQVVLLSSKYTTKYPIFSKKT